MNNYLVPNIFEVWRVPFFFEDQQKSKERPVVVLAVDKRNGLVQVLAAKVTSHAPRPNFQGEVPLEDWREAGLTKPSCVRCSKVAQFPLSYFVAGRKYGILSRRDRMAVVAALRDLGFECKKNSI